MGARIGIFLATVGLLAGCDLVSGTGGGGGDLQGSWKSACTGSSASTYARIVISGNAADLTQLAFSDATCATAASVVTLKYTWTGGTAVTTPAGAKTMDLTKAGMKATAITPAIAASWNTSQQCGITDWSAGVERDVAGKTCDAAPANTFTIYQVTGNTLRLGDPDSTHDGETAAARPVELDDTVLTKE